jgi:hypothetical protein
MKPFRALSYANVTATLALVVALGGTGYAATRIGTSDIEDGAITSSKIANGAVVASKIGEGAVNAKALAAKAVKPAAVDGAERFPIKVKDATTINGLASSNFVRGSGGAGVFSVKTATPETVVNVKGFGKLGVGCDKAQGFARFTNTSGEPIVVSIGSTGGPVRSNTVSSGGAINGPTTSGPQLQTWQIRLGDETKHTVATMWIVFVGGADKSCAGSAQALRT